jgi:hypothetical protein
LEFKEYQMFSRYSFVIASLALLSACGSQLSLENYNKLKVGQSYDEVKQVIGDPARCDEALGVRTCVWGDEQRGISVNFFAGKVLLLSARSLK